MNKKHALVLIALVAISLKVLATVKIDIPVTGGIVTLVPLQENALRIQFNKNDAKQMPELIYVEDSKYNPTYKIEKEENKTTVVLASMRISINSNNGLLSVFDNKGELVFSEIAHSLERSIIQDEPTQIASMTFYSPKDEYLFGLGQFQDGYMNVRGLSRRLTQVNTQISIPMIISNKGYGVLWNNYGMTEFNPADTSVRLVKQEKAGEKELVDVTSSTGGVKEERETNRFEGELNIKEDGEYSILLDVGQTMARRHNLSIDGTEVIEMKNLWLPPTTSAIITLKAGKHKIESFLEKDDKPILYYQKIEDKTTFRSPVAQGIDYTLFLGNPHKVVSTYRLVTGGSPMMPIWALGYIHCRERFHTQEEILTTANRFKDKNLPMDIIVQDWQYWGKSGWNSMEFDKDNYPNPKLLVDSLHALNNKLMLSVWAKIDKNSTLGKEMDMKGYFIPNTTWVDFFNKDAATFYWKNFSQKLLKPYGIDAWWQDATEPENDDLCGRRVAKGTIPGEVYRNTYPLLVNKTVYEGCREENSSARVMILTRSGFPGIQRYGAAMWSGDVGHDYETLRRQITGGLSLMATGMPWWTYDAGGFFRPGESQYTDKAYHECFIRWLQVATFLPLMRVHGYMSNTEFWNYGTEVTDIARKFLNTRYRLLPYIYSEAAAVSFKGSTLMRPLMMDYIEDSIALKTKYQYMFGPSLMIAPIVEGGVESWELYLPKQDGGWYDFWDNTKYKGGENLTIMAKLDEIPVFVKAGTILPLIEEKTQTTTEINKSAITIQVYPGSDAEYSLYRDNGNDYRYEKGGYAEIYLYWNDSKRELTIKDVKGNYPITNLEFIVKRADKEGEIKRIIYNGKNCKVKFK